VSHARGGDPDARDLPLDSHLHTELSHDADVPIDVYAAAAVERGIAELAVTDHLDFGAGWPSSAGEYPRRERYVRDAAERWAAHGVAIRFGVEITYDRRHEGEIREHLGRTAYDYTIGSVHIGRDSIYHHSRVAGWVAGRGLAAIVTPYFEEVAAAARSGLFDTIGHLDFVKRYLHPHVTPDQLAAAPELYEPVLRTLVDGDVALEINTSGLRQSPAETYPAAWAVARYRELGGRWVTTGSDAHRADWFAWGLARAYEMAAELGYRHLAFRRGASRTAVAIPGRFTRAAERPVPNVEAGRSL
jgi:histidinol-phosphatase (PHP family)